MPIEKQSAVGHLDQSSLASSDEIFPFLLRLERSFGRGANEDIDTFVRVHREDLWRSWGRVSKWGDPYLFRPRLAEPVFPPLLRRKRGGKRRWRSRRAHVRPQASLTRAHRPSLAIRRAPSSRRVSCHGRRRPGERPSPFQPVHRASTSRRDVSSTPWWIFPGHPGSTNQKPEIHVVVSSDKLGSTLTLPVPGKDLDTRPRRSRTVVHTRNKCLLQQCARRAARGATCRCAWHTRLADRSSAWRPVRTLVRRASRLEETPPSGFEILSKGDSSGFEASFEKGTISGSKSDCETEIVRIQNVHLKGEIWDLIGDEARDERETVGRAVHVDAGARCAVPRRANASAKGDEHELFDMHRTRALSSVFTRRFGALGHQVEFRPSSLPPSSSDDIAAAADGRPFFPQAPAHFHVTILTSFGSIHVRNGVERRALRRANRRADLRFG